MELDSQLVGFGDYLLSKYRKGMVKKSQRSVVNDADIYNWKYNSDPEFRKQEEIKSELSQGVFSE